MPPNYTETRGRSGGADWTRYGSLIMPVRKRENALAVVTKNFVNDDPFQRNIAFYGRKKYWLFGNRILRKTVNLSPYPPVIEPTEPLMEIDYMSVWGPQPWWKRLLGY